MKIFCGLVDVASLLSDLKYGFSKLNIETFTAVNHMPHNVMQTNVDVVMPKYPKFWFWGVRPRKLQKWLIEHQHIDKITWRKAIRECDVFLFIWDSFRKDYSDLAELKNLGKKIIFIFCGDDARWYYASKQEFNFHGFPEVTYDRYDYSVKGLEDRLKRIRIAEKYADFIFSRLDNAQLQLRPYYRYQMWVPADKIKANINQRRLCPKIVHAPTNRTFKGTAVILDALQRLKEEGLEFELVLLENVPNQEVLKVYLDADIVIDQLIVPGSGKVSSEAMASGCVVLSHMAYDVYPQKNLPDCPIVDVNIYNFYDVIKSVVLNYDLRLRLAAYGPEFVRNNLDITIFCKKILRLVSGENIDYDYVPTFFNNNFIPENEESIGVYNKWNEYVSGCDWYQKYVNKGQRDGLVF